MRVQGHTLAALYRREDKVSTVQEDGLASGSVWKGAEFVSTTAISFE